MRRDITTVGEVAGWLKSPHGESAELVRAHRSAEDYIARRIGGATSDARWSYRAETDPVTGQPVRDIYGCPVIVFDPEVVPPGDLVMAVFLLAHRYLARRNSPDGLVGMGDQGVGRVPISDRDVDALLRPWLPVIV